jgi:hypothetical protein
MALEETDVASSKKEKSRQAARPAAAAGPLARFLRGRWLALWVVLLLGIFALQAITSMAQKSSTSDESAHLPAGWTCLAAGVRIGDYFAVSATLLDETFPMPDRQVATLVRKFRDEEPVAKIGYSIYIYKSPIIAPAVPIEEIDNKRFQPPPNP